MGTVTPEELLSLWKLEKAPLEMAMGHALQNLVQMNQGIASLRASFYQIRGDVDGLIDHTGTKPRSRGKNKPRKRS